MSRYQKAALIIICLLLLTGVLVTGNMLLNLNDDIAGSSSSYTPNPEPGVTPAGELQSVYEPVYEPEPEPEPYPVDMLWRDAYAEFLLSTAPESIGQPDNDSNQFFVFDIDNSGIPELILSTGEVFAYNLNEDGDNGSNSNDNDAGVVNNITCIGKIDTNPILDRLEQIMAQSGQGSDSDDETDAHFIYDVTYYIPDNGSDGLLRVCYSIYDNYYLSLEKVTADSGSLNIGHIYTFQEYIFTADDTDDLQINPVSVYDAGGEQMTWLEYEWLIIINPYTTAMDFNSITDESIEEIIYGYSQPEAAPEPDPDPDRDWDWGHNPDDSDDLSDLQTPAQILEPVLPWQETYAQFLRNPSKSDYDIQGTIDDFHRFFLVDIDRNGIPEMFVWQYNDREYFELCAVNGRIITGESPYKGIGCSECLIPVNHAYSGVFFFSYLSLTQFDELIEYVTYENGSINIDKLYHRVWRTDGYAGYDFRGYERFTNYRITGYVFDEFTPAQRMAYDNAIAVEDYDITTENIINEIYGYYSER